MSFFPTEIMCWQSGENEADKTPPDKKEWLWIETVLP